MTRAGSFGLSRREQEIMDLHDGGARLETIAETLEIDFDYARAVVRNLSFETCWNNSKRFEREVRASDRQYAARLAASGGSFA